MPKLFSIRKPRLRITGKGIKVQAPTLRIGRKAGINLSKTGVSASLRTKAGSVSTKKGCSLPFFGLLLLALIIWEINI